MYVTHIDLLTEIQQPAGDARFMSIIDRCIGSRMKLLGLENRGGIKEPEKEKGPTTWVEMIAKEIAEREAKTINVTSKAARLAAPRDTKRILLP